MGEARLACVESTRHALTVCREDTLTFERPRRWTALAVSTGEDAGLPDMGLSTSPGQNPLWKWLVEDPDFAGVLMLV
jgi:hypothetical protein